MFIALASLSKDPEVEFSLHAIALALENQLYQHYAPFWQSGGMNVRVVDAKDKDVLSRQDCAPLIVYDEADEPNALGYHSLQAQAQVYGKAFWNIIQSQNGTLTRGSNSLSATLSHEVLEMVGNPYVNFWADVDSETQEAVELCDRVEADVYDINGISVSNFLGPRAFRDGPGPYDWMNLLQNPFDLRPGGYVIRRKGGSVFNVWGATYPEYRKSLKTSPDSRLAKRQALVASKH